MILHIEMRTAMQSASRQSLELRKTIEEVTVRISGSASNVMQFFYISCPDAEGKYRRACILHEIGYRPWITAVAEAIGYQKHYFVRSAAAFLENRLENSR
jgi:hypothetical protein